MSAPCENDGTCLDQVDGYSCNCGSGYSGDDCETGKMKKKDVVLCERDFSPEVRCV